MSENYPHLPLLREEPVTEKRPGGRPFIAQPPANPSRFAEILQEKLSKAEEQVETDIGGFDDRKLFRFEVNKGFNPDDLLHISSEIEFISQEGEEIIVAFVSNNALLSFEARLSSLSRGETIPYKNVLFALKGFDGWTPENRTAWALKKEGFPKKEPFILDIELWPIEEREDERKKLWQTFEAWLEENKIEKVDSVNNPGITLYRVSCNILQAKLLLRHRDVRLVDLPPRYGLQFEVLNTDIQDIPEPPAPPADAPGIVVLDSGLATGHPLLKNAIGDAASFIPGFDEADNYGHGTHVAGIALFGDVENAIRSNEFRPQLRLFSGRILDDNGENNTDFVENHIIEAVHYFHDTYGCKIFNLSFGDNNKPYDGKHIRGLAFILDTLSRELDVLFIVSAGNVREHQQEGLAWKEGYPDYLSNDNWAIIEPAPALNVITVGSLARYDQTYFNQRWPKDVAEIPIARRNQPSPFTRTGPTVNGAIKPEVVAYGGNWAINTRAGANNIVNRGLGEVSTCIRFSEGRLFAEECGTSHAAPYIAHLAGKILAEYQSANANLLRAMLVANAELPSGTSILLPDKKCLRNTCGYGYLDGSALTRSIENDVTLIAEGKISDKRHQFYEIFIPEDFISSGTRTRELTVALAYTPPVRSTRVIYKATRIEFRLVAASDLEYVIQMFNKATSVEEYERITELSGANVGTKLRSKGTVQSDNWSWTRFRSNSILSKNRLFLVVTRNDFPWGTNLTLTDEPYAITVCLRDRSNESARLYTQIQNRLRTRARAKV